MTFTSAISACAKGGKWEEAVGLLTDLELRGIMPNVHSFNAAIAACGKSGR
jgi:pentatricopeptide repeat protein